VSSQDVDLEIQLLLEAIFEKYHYDFRRYGRASMRRRLVRAAHRLGCRTLSALQERVLHEPTVFPQLLEDLTIQVSDLFRDPSYFRAVREQVVPVLATYPSVKLWIAGCATGEEVYSYAILLREEGLLERTIIYATDIHPPALAHAEAGVFALERMPAFSENYQRAGGKGSLSDHYVAGYGGAAFDRSLRARVVFADHSLATDEVFAEVQMVSCRNVLIYFDRGLQDRALRLFADALCPMGFLGLGARETVRFSAQSGRFIDFDREERIFRRA
jgi:chemotaxis protein methyltransferase CheR